jgi:hypothetical protein
MAPKPSQAQASVSSQLLTQITRRKSLHTQRLWASRKRKDDVQTPRLKMLHFQLSVILVPTNSQWPIGTASTIFIPPGLKNNAARVVYITPTGLQVA